MSDKVIVLSINDPIPPFPKDNESQFVWHLPDGYVNAYWAAHPKHPDLYWVLWCTKTEKPVEFEAWGEAEAVRITTEVLAAHRP